MVLVALQDDFLNATFQEIQSAFPNQEFIKVRSSCTSFVPHPCWDSGQRLPAVGVTANKYGNLNP